MKTHLAWMVALGFGGALLGAAPAAGQYSPYEPLPSSSGANTPQPSAGSGAPLIPPYQPQSAAYPQTAAPHVPAGAGYPQVAANYPAAQGTYPSVARQPTEALPMPKGPGAEGAAYPAGNYYYGDSAVHGYPGTSYPGTGYPDYGISSFCDPGCYQTQWFGGVYWLFMERDRQSPTKLTVEVDHAVVPDPYYPPATVTRLISPDHDFRSGVEVRFGSTFTMGDGCHGHHAHGCAPNVYAWEFAWWGLDRDCREFTVVEGDDTRIYGMKNYVGLQYDYNGGGWRPVNDYYGYGLPIDDPGAPPYDDGDIRVLAQRVRSDFRAHNLELNIIRFPMCGPCGPGFGACDPCQPAFTMYGSCGARYFFTDEGFQFATQFTEWTGGAGGGWDYPEYDGFGYDAENELFHRVKVRNFLAGPQVGWAMNYCWWRCNFFLNSTFGIFHNHIRHRQEMFSGGDGYVRFASDGEEFSIRSRKNDVAFLGELRLGAAFDITSHWRAVTAYRAVAVTGIATATDQIPDEFTNKEWVEIIDSDSSMVVHGVQVGVECRY